MKTTKPLELRTTVSYSCIWRPQKEILNDNKLTKTNPGSLPPKRCKDKHSHFLSHYRTRNPSIFNFHVLTFLILAFLCSLSQSDAEHLCGSRLVTVLRHVCGRRGIHSPPQDRYHRRDYSYRRRGANQVRITYLCCELGCNMSQLKGYCGPAHPSPVRQKPSRNIQIPSPPPFVTVPSNQVQKQNPASNHENVASTTPTESRSVNSNTRRPHLLFEKLASRHKKLLKQNRIEVGVEIGLGRRNSLLEIIQPRIHREPNEAQVVVANSKFVKGILNYTAGNHY